MIPQSGVLGAELRGLDLSRHDAAMRADLHQALLAYGYVFVRKQNLTPAMLCAFAQHWGELHSHPYMPGIDGYPEVIEIVKKETDVHTFGGQWHTDQMFTRTPAMGTLLYAIEVPPAGGDTMFGCLHTAYDGLSPAMRQMLAPLRTVNIYDKQRPRAAVMERQVVDKDVPAEAAVHPLVRPHQETGRPALYISHDRITRRIEGMSDAESRPLLDFLRQHSIRPEFTSRLRWEPGTLAFWDNRRVQHMAVNDYQGHRRVMHRVTVRGTDTTRPV
ncbi:MAG: TauD/TfdA family dioxygenase [Pseudomonadota bacterium]